MSYCTFKKSLPSLKDRHLWLILVALTLTMTAASSPEDAVFVAGTLPVDTDGNPVRTYVPARQPELLYMMRFYGVPSFQQRPTS